MALLGPTALYTAQNAARTDGSERPTRSPSSLTGGTLKFLNASYTLLGTEATSDTLLLAVLPKGALLMRGNSHVTCLDPGTTLTLSVGVSGNVDQYASGIVMSAGASVSFGSTVAAAAADLVPAATTDNTDLLVTFANVNTPTAGVILYFSIAYLDWN